MLLFLHGFLGQKEDWDPLLSHLPGLHVQCIDLPYEADDIAAAVKAMVPTAKAVIGYSAGGRLALELKARFPKDYEKIIALSAHPGLKSDEEKKARWKIDLLWIDLLKDGPFDEFLKKWYDQDLFASLRKHPHFNAILQRRKTQNPAHLAHFLEHFSLGKKEAPEIDPRTIFVYGKEDLKYAQHYRIFEAFAIENAGHAVHLENPKACANIILGAVNEHY